MRLNYLILVFTGLFTCIQVLQSNEKRTYQAERLITTAPRIDGKLDDIAWNQGQWQDGFVQFEPYNSSKPSHETKFKLLFDDNNIYVAIRAYDSAPDSIVERVSRRDNLDGDYAGIGFDSYFDQRTAFIFLVNAAGSKSDFIMSNDGQNEDDTWDPVWYVKTSIDEEGWVAEMQIPFNQLRFSNSSELTWGLQVVRGIFRKQEQSFWQQIPRDAPGIVHRFGLLTGINAVKPKRLAEISPYTVAQTETFLKQPGNPFLDGSSSRFSGGIDGKIGLTNDLTVNFTINPDFGQVEADPSEVNLTAFETWFQEKRPFFVEGRNIFNYNLMSGDGDHSSENLFYSRRIGRTPQYYPSLNGNEYMNFPGNTKILGALKLSGKTKSGWSVGVLESVTGREQAEIDFSGDRSFQTVEPLTNYFVGRLQKDINEGNTIIGGLVTATNRNLEDPALNFLHRSAYTAGFDFRHSWKEKTYSINIKTFFSHVAGDEEALLRTQTAPSRYFQRPDAQHLAVDSTRRSLSGHGGTIEFMKAGNGKWNYATFLNWKSPGLELNDIGFVRNTDEIFHVIWVGYRLYEPFSIFRRAGVNFNAWNGFDFGGTHLYKGVNVNFHTQFKNYWSLGSGIGYNGESVSKGFLRGGPSMRIPDGINTWTNFSSDSRKKFTISAGASNYWSLEKHTLSQSYWISTSYRPLDAFSFSLRPMISLNQPKLQYVTRESFGGENKYIHGSLDQKTYSLTLRLNYSITPDLSIQYYGAPFFSTGKYSKFKYITNPHADQFTERFAYYDSEQLFYNSSESRYYVDENRDGTHDYNFAKPDFNAMFLNSNLVVRWEYRPSSVLFLVWSQGRNQYDTNGDFRIQSDFGDIFEIYPHNVFLIKFSYRFGL